VTTTEEPSDASADDGLLSDLDDGILTLTIDRPEAGNSLDELTRLSMVGALRRADADISVRAVVLTASGDKAFCSGADLRVASATFPRPEGTPENVQGDMARLVATGWQVLFTSLMDCEKPVIAAVNGVAAGGGMQLVLACDLVFMASTARLAPAFIRRGLVPDAGGAYMTTRLIGPQRAKQVYMLGDDISADEAVRMGLANFVVPPDELAATATRYARRLADGPTRALAMTKRLINHALDSDRHAALSEEALSQEMVRATADAEEGIQSFLERRPPRFRGY
jgi:2-(1,2-epoxy-1,2-dihydrophenyl)acetyl-CoA isomerase